MDLAAVWQEVALFHEKGIATSAHIHAGEQEYALVREFLEKVPIAELFACLQDASDRGSAKQIVPFILAGLGHVEKEARVLVVNQFIAHLGREPALEQVQVVADPLILDCLKSNDPLFLMNVVDLVPTVCQTKIGVQYIFQSGKH
ncbi:hypothetical protein BBJ28_00019918 [Nothophytophthora sp. Chile5]|nr:hypothetical protein BBJ28_00019918 [Nothophytophthora sp. Chile5]